MDKKPLYGYTGVALLLSVELFLKQFIRDDLSIANSHCERNDKDDAIKVWHMLKP